jgi:hypothetical protein
MPEIKTPRAIVEQWFNESFRDSVVARDTEVWNAVHKAKDDLIACLEGRPAPAAPNATGTGATAAAAAPAPAKA